MRLRETDNGVILGLPIVGKMADVFGRRPIALLAVASSSILLIIGAFVKNYW